MRSKVKRVTSRPRRPRQLKEAKARFSEVFRLARTQGLQRITRHGTEAVVVMAAEDFDRLSRGPTEPESLVDFLARSPLAGSGTDLRRKPDYGREIDL